MKKCVIIALLALVACSQQQNKPSTSTPEVLKSVYYSGQHNDLLTAGLGLSGLRGAPPELSANPSADELRRLSYHQQFKALNDLTVDGGYGRLYGISETQAPVAGWEHWTQREVAPGVYHTVVLQVPDAFDVSQACLVVAPSSGSRNVFGAVGTSGSWALINGCAVVYTDKGTGTEITLSGDRVYRIDGTIGHRGDLLQTATDLPIGKIHQVVQKHAYSQVHPERYWGQFVLDAAEFAIQQLKTRQSINRPQLKVIAASVSNGGGAVLRAAEQDRQGLLDAVVAAEPQVNVRHAYTWHGPGGQQAVSARPLLELSMHLALLEPCAALDDELDAAPFKFNTGLIVPLLQQRCQLLADGGLIAGSNTAAQAADALRQIKQLNLEPAALQLAQINTLANLWAAINHTYSNSYLRTQPQDNLCQSAMSAFTTGGQPRRLTPVEEQAMFALSNGIAPGNGIELGITDAHGEVTGRLLAAPGYGMKVQQCFRDLLNRQDMQQAIEQIMAQPENNPLPTVLLHGQADGTVAINHSSRAYYHQNQASANANPRMRLYDIERVQHFDAFLAFPGFADAFVPMHPYFEQALDMMLGHLTSGEDLSPSQLVRTANRQQTAQGLEPLSAASIPVLKANPDHPLRVTHTTLEVQ